MKTPTLPPRSDRENDVSDTVIVRAGRGSNETVTTGCFLYYANIWQVHGFERTIVHEWWPMPKAGTGRPALNKEG